MKFQIKGLEEITLFKNFEKFVKIIKFYFSNDLVKTASPKPYFSNRDHIKTDSSKVDSSKVDSSKVDSSKLDCSKVDSSKVDSSKVDSSNPNLVHSIIPTKYFVLEFIIYQINDEVIIKGKKFEEIEKIPENILLPKRKDIVELPLRREGKIYRVPSEIRCEYLYYNEYSDQKLDVHFERFIIT